MAASSPSVAACAESAAASSLSAAASAERASAGADRAAAAAETAAAATATVAANVESARAAVRAADVALARVEAIHAKIFQATSESSMQPISKKAAVAMEHLLPYEVVEWELEMQEAAEIEERRDEELHVAQVEVEKSLSTGVEYQRELWRNHYYKYYNLEGGAEDEDEDVVYFSRGDAESTNGLMSPGQVIDISSHTGYA